MCSRCLLSVCDFYSFPILILRVGFGFWLLQFLFIAFLLLSPYVIFILCLFRFGLLSDHLFGNSRSLDWQFVYFICIWAIFNLGISCLDLEDWVRFWLLHLLVFAYVLLLTKKKCHTHVVFYIILYLKALSFNLTNLIQYCSFAFGFLLKTAKFILHYFILRRYEAY